MIINLKHIKSIHFTKANAISAKEISTEIVGEIPTITHTVGFDKTNLSSKIGGIQYPNSGCFTTGPEEWYYSARVTIELMDGERISNHLDYILSSELIDILDERVNRFLNRRLKVKEYFLTKKDIIDYIIDKIKSFE